MPDLFTLNQEYSFCLSKARVICVKMTSSIDRLPTHCACTLRQHSEYIEQHTQRFFLHPVASCNVHLVLFPCICWDFTKVLLCEWRSWFIKPDFTSIQAICPAVLELWQGHSTPIPWHLCRTLLFKSSSIWQMTQIHSKKLRNMWACLKRWHTCVLGREKEGAVEQISQLTSSSAHPRPACPYYYPAGAQSGPLLQGYNCLHHHQHQSPPTSREHLLQWVTSGCASTSGSWCAGPTRPSSCPACSRCGEQTIFWHWQQCFRVASPPSKWEVDPWSSPVFRSVENLQSNDHICLVQCLCNC